MAAIEYGYEYVYAGERVRLGVHCRGVAREPRVRWQVGEQCGERGYVHRNAPEPVVRLEADETVWVGGRLVSAIPVSHEIGAELDAACEALGTIGSEATHITADPAAFPAEIDGFERIGWESTRCVMWYQANQRSPPRAYQIERGVIVFRAQEWIASCSKNDLVERYDLDAVP